MPGSQRSQTKIRICYVIDSLRRDGTQTALLNLVEGLAECGYEQKVYCLNDVADHELVRLFREAGAEVVIIGKAALLTARGCVRILRDFLRWKPAIVQTFLPFGDVIGRTLARIAGVPVIVSSIRARNVDKPPWQLILDRITVRWARKVVFNSMHTIEFALAKEGVRPDQVVYIPNGVRTRDLRAGRTRGDVLSELGIPTEKKVVATIGRLYPQKGHVHLIAAFAQVLVKIPEAILVIIGKGPLLEDLQSEAARLGISASIRFLGERSDVPEIMEGIDLYVQASLWEGMPNAVMEAMACGRPVITTDVDGTRELVEHERTGWLVRPADETALAERIVYALEHPSEAKSVAHQAAKKIGTEFSCAKMVSRFDTLYRELAAGSRA